MRQVRACRLPAGKTATRASAEHVRRAYPPVPDPCLKAASRRQLLAECRRHSSGAGGLLCSGRAGALAAGAGVHPSPATALAACELEACHCLHCNSASCARQTAPVFKQEVCYRKYKTQT